MDINNLKNCVTHEEATIKSYMREPEFADFMLKEAIAEGDTREIEKIQRRIKEAKRRTQQLEYWETVIVNAENTAKTGYDIDTIIAIVSKALGILKAAVHNGVQ